MASNRRSLVFIEGSYKKRIEDVLREAQVDIEKLGEESSRKLTRDIFKFSLDTVPVFTGTLKKSGRIRFKSGRDWAGGTITFDATQKEQYDNMSQRLRSKLMNASSTRNLHNYRTNHYGDVEWDLEDPNASYADKLPGENGQPYFIDDAIYATIYSKPKITDEILGQKITLDGIPKALKEAWENQGIRLSREHLRQEAEELRQKKRRKDIDALKDEIKDLNESNKNIYDLYKEHLETEEIEVVDAEMANYIRTNWIPYSGTLSAEVEMGRFTGNYKVRSTAVDLAVRAMNKERIKSATKQLKDTTKKTTMYYRTVNKKKRLASAKRRARKRSEW